MQAVQFYQDSDDVVVQVGRVEVNAPHTEDAMKTAGLLQANGEPNRRRHSGLVHAPLAYCDVMWWADAAEPALHLVAVTRDHHASTAPGGSVRHVSVAYSQPCVGAFVALNVDRGQSTLSVTWATATGDIVVSIVRVFTTEQRAIELQYVSSTAFTVKLDGEHRPIVAVAPAAIPGAAGDAEGAVCMLVASTAAIYHVALVDGTTQESPVASTTGTAAISGEAIASIAFANSRSLLVVACESGNVAQFRASSAGLDHLETVSLGASLTSRCPLGLREPDAEDADIELLIPARDTRAACECVLRLVASGGSGTAAFALQGRVSGFGSAAVASVPTGSEAAVVAWSEAHYTGPLIAGAPTTSSGSTLLHCPAVSRGPIHVPLADPVAAVVVNSAATDGTNPVVLLAFGRGRRVRLYAATRVATYHDAAGCVYYPATDATFGRLSGAAPAFVPVVEAVPAGFAAPSQVLEAALENESAAWHGPVAAGALAVEAAPHGPDMLRQLLAVGLARASALPRSDIFTRIAGECAACSYDGPSFSEDTFRDAVRALLDAPSGDTPCRSADGTTPAWATPDVTGPFLPASQRWIAGMIQSELMRRLLGLLYLEIARVSQPTATSAGLARSVKVAMLNVAGALAVARACAHHVALLTVESVSGVTKAPQQVVGTVLRALLIDAAALGDVADADLSNLCVNVGAFLQNPPSGTLPASVVKAVAVRATAAWTATWFDTLPVMRHFAIMDLLYARRCTTAHSNELLKHLLGTMDAISSLDNPAMAVRMVKAIAPALVPPDSDLAADDENEAALVLQDQQSEDGHDSASLAIAYYATCMVNCCTRQGRLLSADDAQRLLGDVEKFAGMLPTGGDDDAPVSAAIDGVAEAVRSVLLELHITVCRHATLHGDFATALRALDRISAVGGHFSDLRLSESAQFVVSAIVEAGAVAALVESTIARDDVAQAIARYLYSCVLDPKGSAADREARELQRVDMCTTLYAFLLSRGAIANAARMAYDTAAAMRSAPQRTEGTLDRALELLSHALNTADVMPTSGPVEAEAVDEFRTMGSPGSPPDSRHWSDTTIQREGTTFSVASTGAVPATESTAVASIGALTTSDLPELRRRWHQLRCEAKLARTGAAACACAPWSPLGDVALAPDDVDAANETVKELIRARLWRDALVLAEAWKLDSHPVFCSYAADLLESSATEAQWTALVSWLSARSETANNHGPLCRTLLHCLQHSHYRRTPDALHKAVQRHTAEGVLACYLGTPRISDTTMQRALDVGVRYCRATAVSSGSPDYAGAGLSPTGISVAMLDRLHRYAKNIVSGGGGGGEKSERTVKAAKDFIASFAQLVKGASSN